MIIRAFLFIFSLLSLASCQKTVQNNEQAPKDLDSYLHISFQTEVCSLDPRVGIDYASGFAIKMLFEGLTHIGLDGKPHPGIAQSYEISEDHKTYIFHLRPCVWSNGDQVTAYDFEYSWKKVIGPNTTTTLGVHNFYPIKNVRAILREEKPLDSVGIKSLDAKTLQVDLEHPTPYFLEVLSTPSFLPVNARIDQENPNWTNLDGADFVCNGPFILEKHRLENELIVVKNPTYWDASSVKLPGIQIAIIKDATTQLSLFEKNELQWLGHPISKIPLDAMTHLKNQGKIQFSKTLGLYWYYLNTESFPFNNKKMRKAFAYAVNRQVITDYVLQGIEKPAMGVLPHSLATQESPYFADNDQEEALKLFNEVLDELGLTREEFPEITINHVSFPVHSRIAEALQQQWSRVFGVKIRLEHQEWKSHFAKLQNGHFQIGGLYWQSWVRDPIYIMQLFRDKSDATNMSRWENAEYARLISAAEQEFDPAIRKHLFNQAETLLMDEMPVIPIFFMSLNYSKDEKLKNVYISDLYQVDFRWAYFDQ